MSSSWRYVSEARGHLVEVYEQLLGMPLDRPRRCFVGMHPEEAMMAAEMKAANEWHDQRVAKLMGVVQVLNNYDVGRAISDWREHAIAFLHKTPSARDKQKFRDNDDRILFLCVALWYVRAAVDWLNEREDEGLLQGGLSYREMTAKAADFGSRRESIEQTATHILPEETSIVDEMEEKDPRLARYQKWTYVTLDIDLF